MKIPLLLFPSLLISCSLPQTEIQPEIQGKESAEVAPAQSATKSAAKVHKPKSTIEIRGPEDWPKGVGKVTQKDGWLIIDGAGWALDGSRLPGKCEQNENNPPVLRIKRDKVVLKNFEIRQSFNGLFTSNNNVIFDSLYFSSICEDAINPSRCTNITIKNCYLQGAYDKTLQLNYCKNALVENNSIVGGINGVRFMGTMGIIRGNKFVNCDTAIQTTKKGISTVSANSFVGVKTRYKTEEGGKNMVD